MFFYPLSRFQASFNLSLACLGEPLFVGHFVVARAVKIFNGEEVFITPGEMKAVGLVIDGQ